MLLWFWLAAVAIKSQKQHRLWPAAPLLVNDFATTQAGSVQTFRVIMLFSAHNLVTELLWWSMRIELAWQLIRAAASSKLLLVSVGSTKYFVQTTLAQYLKVTCSWLPIIHYIVWYACSKVPPKVRGGGGSKVRSLCVCDCYLYSPFFFIHTL